MAFKGGLTLSRGMIWCGEGDALLFMEGMLLPACQFLKNLTWLVSARARKELAGIFGNIIRNRKASGKSEPDMLQAFIDSKYRSLGRHTTEEECTGLLIAALFAGQHTSSITSTWTGAYLMR